MLTRIVACSLLALYPFHSALAERMLTLYRQSLNIVGDSARGVNFRMEVSCENQSGVPQTVKLELLDANIQTSICSNATNLTGWRGRGNCWWDGYLKLDTTESTMTVPALSGREVLFTKSCVYTPTGLDCDKVYELDKMANGNFKFNSPVPASSRPTCDGVPSPCLRTATAEFESRIRATVTPDRGAVVCAAFLSLNLPFTGETASQIVTPLNGGRPF